MRQLIAASVVVALVAPAAWCADNKLTREEKQDGWKLLYNGRSLKGWMTSEQRKPECGVEEDGTLNPHRCGGYLLVTERQYGDFILSLDFKLAAEANSGVFLRTAPLMPWRDNKIWENSIEVQVLDSPDATPYDCGAFYDLVAPSKNALRPLGEWNRMVIQAEGDIISVNLNGEDVNRIDLSEYTEPYRKPNGEEHKFPAAFAHHPKRGHIGIQDHGDNVWYKNIKIKVLGEE